MCVATPFFGVKFARNLTLTPLLGGPGNTQIQKFGAFPIPKVPETLSHDRNRARGSAPKIPFFRGQFFASSPEHWYYGKGASPTQARDFIPLYLSLKGNWTEVENKKVTDRRIFLGCAGRKQAAPHPRADFARAARRPFSQEIAGETTSITDEQNLPEAARRPFSRELARKRASSPTS